MYLNFWIYMKGAIPLHSIVGNGKGDLVLVIFPVRSLAFYLSHYFFRRSPVSRKHVVSKNIFASFMIYC